MDWVEGEVLLIDKPYQWTSFDVVKKIRGILGIKKIGHAGTLDPLATGLLILCTGKKTKQIDTFQGQEKEYAGKILLGKTTPSADLETAFDSEKDTSHLTPKKIEAAAASFLETQMQIPPLFSALKIDGERAYKKARRGETVAPKAREVFIKEFLITGYALPYISFNLICSKGTYVRSLARDLGEVLGTGGCLAELRRTRIGAFKVTEALSLSDVEEMQKDL